MTDDLFEAFEERAAIMQHCGGMSQADAEKAAREDVERHRHACEVRAVVKMPDHETRREYFAEVEKKRGKAAADRIRKEAWELMR